MRAVVDRTVPDSLLTVLALGHVFVAQEKRVAQAAFFQVGQRRAAAPRKIKPSFCSSTSPRMMGPLASGPVQGCWGSPLPETQA